MLRRQEQGSGTSAAMRSLLGVEELAAADAHQGVAADDFKGLIQGTGWWVYYVSAQEELDRQGFRLLQVDGEEPSIYNIGTGQYPLVRPLNLLTRAGQPIPELVTWAGKEDARPVFEPLFMAHTTSADVEAAPLDAACPGQAQEPIQGTRVGALYFGAGDATELRNPWQLAPIVRASIAAAQDLGKDLAIVGYTDANAFSVEKNCELASERVGYVHGVVASELSDMAEAEGLPKLRGPVVGGPTRVWGVEAPDNRVVVIMAVDRTPTP